MNLENIFELVKAFKGKEIEYTEEIEEFLKKNDDLKITRFIEAVYSDYVDNYNLTSCLKAIKYGVENLYPYLDFINNLSFPMVKKILETEKVLESQGKDTTLFLNEMEVLVNCFSFENYKLKIKSQIIKSICNIAIKIDRLHHLNSSTIFGAFKGLISHCNLNTIILREALLSSEIILEKAYDAFWFNVYDKKGSANKITLSKEKIDKVVEYCETLCAEEIVINRYVIEENDFIKEKIENYMDFVIAKAKVCSGEKERTELKLTHDFGYNILPLLYESYYHARLEDNHIKTNFIGEVSQEVSFYNWSSEEEIKYSQQLALLVDRLSPKSLELMTDMLGYETFYTMLSFMELIYELDEAEKEGKISQVDKENYLIAAYTYNDIEFNTNLINIINEDKQAMLVDESGESNIRIITISDFMKFLIDENTDINLKTNFYRNFKMLSSFENISLDSRIPVEKKLGVKN